MSSACTICGAEHNRTWHKRPHRYCVTCHELKRRAKGTATSVLGSIYLGDMIAGGKFEGKKLCVYDNKPTYEGEYFHVPILSIPPNDPINRHGAVASLKALNDASSIINFHLHSNEKLLVHCMGGVERSPLTIAYFLVESGRFPSLKIAYEFLKSIRPVVSDRTYWLPTSYRAP